MNPLATLGLDKYAGTAQPFQQSPAAPQVNPVQAPTIQVQHTGAPGSSAPAVTASGPGPVVVDHSATPLQPSVAAPSTPQVYNGQIMSPDQYVQTVTQEQAAAAEAAKNAPKEQKMPAPAHADTPLHDSLIASWQQRLKSASDPVFQPVDPQTHSFFNAGGLVGGYGSDTSYNPFDKLTHPFMHPLYSFAKKMALGRLLNVAPKPPIAMDNVKDPWIQRFAANSADPEFGVGGPNPMLAMAANSFGRFAGGQPDPAAMQQQYGPAMSEAAMGFRGA